MRISKYSPEVTLRIIRHSTSKEPSCWTYGPKAVERRVIRCCDDNPECRFAVECDRLYTKFVNVTDNPREPSGGYERPRPSVIETYKLHGIKLNDNIVRC
jgi:hypothetical protein